MSKIILSICIPTYNRAEYIGEAIESVLQQITPDIKEKVEICVSDNASTDNTENLVKEYQKKNICNIVYYKNKENIGADRNFLKVIEIANGEYCWWLGSDDALETNVLTKLVTKIEKTKSDFYLLTQNCYNSSLLKKIPCNKHPLLEKKEGILTVEDILNSSIYLLGYISVLIVKKAIFMQKAPREEKYIGSMYIHTYKILYALKNGANMYFIRQPMIKWRADNDSFLDELKLFGRIKIDIEGYSSIARDVFGENSIEYKKIVKERVIRNMLRHILLLKLNKVPKYQIMHLYDCIKHYPFYYFIAYILSSIPSSIASLARTIYRKTFKRY